jgi:LysR family glycine cleavage system transcriptional activator
MGVALGRLTMARPMLESGRLVELTGHRLQDRYGHYLVYPPRSEQHPALVSFRSWVLGVAGAESAEVGRPRLGRQASPARRAARPRRR